MIVDNDIIKEGHPTLRLIATKCVEPISREDLSTMKKMLKHLEASQNEKLAKKYGIRAGVGIAAPQINVSKRFFALLIPNEEYTLELGVFNPEIIAESVEMTYLSSGEGCLSVPEKSGVVLRHKKIKVKAIFYNPKDKTLEESIKTFKDYEAIVFQHEFDHLNGVLFIDKITQDTKDHKPIF